MAEFEKQGLKPKITMSNNPRIDSYVGIDWTGLVSASKTMINQDLQQLNVKFEMNRQLGMVWHPGRTQSRAVQELIAMMN